MNIFKKYIKIHAPALLLLPLLFIPGMGLAAEQGATATQPPSFRLDATIMQIDLPGNKMVVAEREIRLLSEVTDGKTVWLTRFTDAANKDIPVERFKDRDRVLVTGNQVSPMVIEAYSVSLAPTSLRAAPKPQSPPQVSPDPSSPIRQEGGVWKN